MSRCLAILAALVLTGTPLSVAHAQAPKGEVTVTEADRKAFRDEIALAGAGETFDLIRKFYPNEYLAFEADLIAANRNGVPAAELQTRTFNFAKSVRERVMPYTKRAPAADLVGFGREQLELMDQIRPSNPRMCYEYVEIGGPSQEALATAPDNFTRRLGVHNSLQFELAAKGQTHPIQRAPASSADFQAAVAAFNQAGGDPAWLQAMVAAKPRTQTDDARCQAAMTWIKAVVSLPEEQAARILAQ